MKKKILNFLLTLTLFGFINNSFSDSRIISSSNKGVYVKAETKIDLFNSNGDLLISKFIKSNGFILDNIDYSKFEYGKYVLELHKDLEVNIYTMQISDLGVVFFDFTEKYFKPYIINKNHKIFVNKLNLIPTVVEISIFYENELIYNELIPDKIKLERLYSLDDSKRGRYKVIVSAEGKYYSSILYL